MLLVMGLLLLTENALALQSRGEQSCGEWIKERNAKGASYERAWLLGYLSGLVAALNKDFFGGTNTPFNSLDNESIYLWMDNYCRANPLKLMSSGAIDLFLEVTKDR